MNIVTSSISAATAGLLDEVALQLTEGRIVPYLGPGLIGNANDVPMSTTALADFLGARVTLPGRARGNLWAAAQYIESYRHRKTVGALMMEAMQAPVTPHEFHLHIASLGLPLIVDSWYASVMRMALSGQESWCEVQGTDRTGVSDFSWYRFYDEGGEEIGEAAASGRRTVLYAPHGGVRPAGNFLVSDADYVEVLTEIDIQTPIPGIVRQRRTSRGFLFIGCRFDDQLLRTYARQIAKRSADTHYAVCDPDVLTRNEQRFLAEMNIVPILAPIDEAASALMR